MEGLAYLTLDADVKDDFVQDIPALQAMFELAKARVVQISKLRKGAWLWCSGLSRLHSPCEAGLALSLDGPRFAWL